MSEYTLNRRQLYILPTRIGWFFALILLALFATAIKYNNQLAFMMTFFLASLGQVSSLYTHRNLLDINISIKPAHSTFVGKQALFPILIGHSRQTARYNLWLICDTFKQTFNLKAQQTFSAKIEISANKRGYMPCPPVTLSSQYPIGILFSWSRAFKSKQTCLVYPQPKSFYPLPIDNTGTSADETIRSYATGYEDFNGLRPYEPGDSLRHIHWASMAKLQKPITKQYASNSGSAVLLDWSQLPDTLDKEDKLSQLCQWVLDAEQQQLRYALKLFNNHAEFSSGNQHMHNCLKELALCD